jgi:ERCC4-related helicase
MSDLGLLIFDEAHHAAAGDHPYAQLLQDFYATAPADHRPQVLGLTASPGVCAPDVSACACGVGGRARVT